VLKHHKQRWILLLKGLDNPTGKAKIPPISGFSFRLTGSRRASGFMTPIPPSQVPEKSSQMNQCKHPRVQIVSRDEDSEFVECLVCGDVFESSEFKDMAIEETKLENES
jgi:hypothetical protein